MNDSRKKLNISMLKDSIIQKNKLKEGLYHKQPKIRLSLLTNEIKKTQNSPIKINFKKRNSVFENFNKDNLTKLTENTKIETNDDTNNEKNVASDDSNSNIINEVDDVEYIKERSKKKHSSAFNFSKDIRKNLLKKCEGYENERILKLKNKQRENIMKQLMINRRKIKEIMVFTNNSNSINILSNRIESINNQILRLIKLINGEDVPSKPKKKKSGNKNLEIDDKYDKYLNFNKHSFRFVNKFLKICDILRECKIMDIKSIANVIKDKPNFDCLRSKSVNEYVPKTEYTKNNRKYYNQTLYKKSFKINGFTSYNNEENTLNLHENFNDILFDIENNNSASQRNFSKIKNQLNTISTNQSDKNKFNNTSFNHSISCRINSSKNKSKKFNLNKKNNSIKLKLDDSSEINQNSQIEKKSRDNIKNDINELSNKIAHVLNDGNIIKESLLLEIKENEQKPEKKNKSHLLKIADKIYAKEDLKRNPSKIPKRKKYSKPNLILNLENEFVKELKIIPKSIRPEFREIFKKMLTEDRILNKRDPRYMNAYEQKMLYIHEQEQFKKEANQNMFTLKDNVFSGNEDYEVFKNEMDFDNYGNLSSLEWLLCKQKLLYSNKNRLIGAYNPKEKLHFNINYPPEQIII